MMRELIKPATFFLLLALMAGNAVAEGQEFYKGNDEGWFWYHDPEILPEPEPEEKKELPPAPPPPESEPSESEPKGPPSFSVQWFQENMEQVLNRAIDDPSDDNVAAYFFIHRLMMDKANKFAVTARAVAMDNPQLDERSRATPGGAADRLQDKQKLIILESLTRRINEADGAIWFWFGDDVYSLNQARVLRGLRNRTGIKIIAFSVTGKPPQGEAAKWFPDYVVDSGSAARSAGVSNTPALAMALPPDKVQLLSHGLVGRSEIEKRMIIAGDRLGIIESDEMDIYQGRNPGAGLIDPKQLSEIEGNDTDEILEVMGEMFGY